jgi:hypothetical protein
VAVNNTSAGVDWMKLTKLPDPPPPDPQGDVVIPNAIAAYVRDGSFATTNYGSATDLFVKRSSNTGYTREGYLTFDVSTLAAGSITGAKLRLFGKLTVAGAGVDVAAYGVSNTGWSESTVNWNTRPASGATALSSNTVGSTTAAWYEWDVTSLVQQARAAGQPLVSIALKAANVTTDPMAQFNSDDAASNTPELSITTAAPTQDIVLSAGSVPVNEGSQGSVTVKLATQPTSDVTVTISKDAGGDDDLSAALSSLVFTSANWDQPQTVNVFAAEDADFTERIGDFHARVGRLVVQDADRDGSRQRHAAAATDTGRLAGDVDRQRGKPGTVYREARPGADVGRDRHDLEERGR